MRAALTNTIVVSDLHLAQIEKRPNALWKRYSHPQFAAGRRIARFMNELVERHKDETFEFVFNGDTFDFDQIQLDPTGIVRKSKERIQRLITTSKEVSHEKIRILVRDHAEFFEALGTLVEKGHSVVFIRGNHDIELTWTGVQQQIRTAIASRVNATQRKVAEQRVRFYDWFYYKKGEFYIEHGNQYDRFAVNEHNLYPFTEQGEVELSFGSISSRLIHEKLGFFNPNVEESFLQSVFGYARHFFKYHVPSKIPLFRPWVKGTWDAVRVSLQIPKLKKIDTASVHETMMHKLVGETSIPVRTLRKIQSLQMPSVLTSRAKVFKMSGLDRIVSVFSFVAIVLALLIINAFVNESALWFALGGVVVAFIGVFFLLQRTKTAANESNHEDAAPVIAESLDAPNIVMGHTHKPLKRAVGKGKWYFNTGTWAPCFYDVECTQQVEDTETFVWIKGRVANLFKWSNGSWKEEGGNETEK